MNSKSYGKKSKNLSTQRNPKQKGSHFLISNDTSDTRPLGKEPHAYIAFLTLLPSRIARLVAKIELSKLSPHPIVKSF